MYQLTKSENGVVLENIIRRTADNAFIPFDPANSDYQEYLRWLEEGNEPEPADPVGE